MEKEKLFPTFVETDNNVNPQSSFSKMLNYILTNLAQEWNKIIQLQRYLAQCLEYNLFKVVGPDFHFMEDWI